MSGTNSSFRNCCLGLGLCVLAALPLNAADIKATRLESGQPAGKFVIEARQGGQWVKLGELSADRHLKTVSLAKVNARELRVTKSGGGSAHLDSLMIDGQAPLKVSGSGDKLALKKLAASDNDLVNLPPAGLIVTLPAAKAGQLSLCGRIENERISQIPFQFPRANFYQTMNPGSAFYAYRLNSGSMAKPFFKELCEPGSGHPDGYLYGWVANDARNLKVRLDFTSDNTMDGAKDYAKVYVKAGDKLKCFTQSMNETGYGQPAFTYTDKVGYQHKLYEFKIPRAELPKGDRLELAFAAYGTAALGNELAKTVYDSVNHRYLEVFTYTISGGNPQIYGKIINADGSTYKDSFRIRDAHASNSTSPAVAFDPASRRYLVVWTDQRGGNDDIYAQLVSETGTLVDANGDPAVANTALVATAGSSQRMPGVACDTDAGKFMVVWLDAAADPDGDVRALLWPASGAPDAPFDVCTDGAVQSWPTVAFDPVTDRYLVAWGDYRTGNYNILAKLFDSGGGSASAELPVKVADGQQTYPRLACAPTGSNFMVVYYDGSDSRMYGRRVNATAGAMDDAFAISAASAVQWECGLAWGLDRYLVTWVDSRNSGSTGNDIYGQYVGASGSLSGENFAINAASGDQVYPYVAGNIDNGSFLATWGYTSGGTCYLGADLLNEPAASSTPLVGGSSGGHRCLIASASGGGHLLAGLLSGLLMLAGFRRR